MTHILRLISTNALHKQTHAIHQLYFIIFLVKYIRLGIVMTIVTVNSKCCLNACFTSDRQTFGVYSRSDMSWVHKS